MSLSPIGRTLPHVNGAPLRETGGIAICCPRCRTGLGSLECGCTPFPGQRLRCPMCAFELTHQRGIWLAIPEDRLQKLERFMTEYQTVRSAEKRGSSGAEFYLALPYVDATGANQDQWRIRSRTFRHLCSKLLAPLEASVGPLAILDLGAGNGWMSYRLAVRGHVPVAVDLLTNDFDGLGAAAHFLEQLPSMFPRFQAEMDRLPFADEQFDCAIFNASFHYSEDFGRTLGEAIRCVKHDGLVIIADTPWYSRSESGEQMLRERRAHFRERFGFASDSLKSLEFLTDLRLQALEDEFGVSWNIERPSYGLRWAARPWIAKLKGAREPSQFRIYTAKVTKR